MSNQRKKPTHSRYHSGERQPLIQLKVPNYSESMAQAIKYSGGKEFHNPLGIEKHTKQ